MLPTAFAVLLVVHGLIHLLGFAKALRLADLPQLTQPIAPLAGLLWAMAALLFVGAAAALYMWPRGWWALGAAAVLVSSFVIVQSWADARYGAVANAIALAGVLFGFLAHGPFSLRAGYDADVDRLLAERASAGFVTDADVAPLPRPVQAYLRVAGAVGRPRVVNFRVRMHGRIRSRPDGRWMPLIAEQYSHVMRPARLFYMTASMLAIPAQGYHRYVGIGASMRVKAAALVPVAAVEGPEMTRSETVTLFNDLCVMAPAALIDRSIAWELIDDRTVRARFTNAGHTIQAVLTFNAAGELTDFVSDDRSRLLPDGTVEKVRWSTPVGEYRSFHGTRLPSGGVARWHDPAGGYDYIELTIDDVEYNVPPR